MKIDMEFKGLEELVKAFESAASDEDIAQVNKTIDLLDGASVCYRRLCRGQGMRNPGKRLFPPLPILCVL